MISGFFLVRKYYAKSSANGHNPEYNEINYTLTHIKSLYPHYLFSLIVMFDYYLVFNLYSIAVGSDSAKSIGELVTKLYDLIPEVLLVQNIGFFNCGMNYPLWQMCTMIISGYFIRALLCYNERITTSFVLPLAIILMKAFLKGGCVEDMWGITGAFYIPDSNFCANVCRRVDRAICNVTLLS